MKTKKEQISKIIKIQVKHTQRNTDTQLGEQKQVFPTTRKMWNPIQRCILSNEMKMKRWNSPTPSGNITRNRKREMRKVWSKEQLWKLEKKTLEVVDCFTLGARVRPSLFFFSFVLRLCLTPSADVWGGCVRNSLLLSFKHKCMNEVLLCI